MTTRRGTAPFATLLTLTIAVGACAGDVESAEESGSAPVQAATLQDGSMGDGEAASTESAPVPPAPDAAPAAPATATVPAAPPAAQPRPRAAQPSAGETAPAPPVAEPVEEVAEEVTPPEAPAVTMVPTGTVMAFAFEVELSTERNVAGDAFSANLLDDVIGEDGDVLLPRGAVLRGRVTEALESPSPDEPAVIRLRVDAIELFGTAHPVMAQVENVAMQTEARDSNRRTAATVGAGAAAGAIVGRVIGRNRSTTVGAVTGAAVGAAVALSARDGHATIPVGAMLTIRLTDNLVVR